MGVKVTMNSDEVRATAGRIEAHFNEIVEACKLFHADIAPTAEKSGVKFLNVLQGHVESMTEIAVQGLETLTDAKSQTEIYINDVEEIANTTGVLEDM